MSIVPGRPDRARVAPRAPEPMLSPAAAPSREELAYGADRDADVIADRLRERFTHFLTGDGRTLIEERCRESLQEHSNWLVSQITREVALALETELTQWVREAVADELERRERGYSGRLQFPLGPSPARCSINPALISASPGRT